PPQAKRTIAGERVRYDARRDSGVAPTRPTVPGRFPDVDGTPAREARDPAEPCITREEIVSSHQQRLRMPELDGCGIGFVADVTGEASRGIVELALDGLACVRHRAAVAADGLSGDGAGILAPLPRAFFARVGSAALGQELDERRVGVVFAFLDLEDDV